VVFALGAAGVDAGIYPASLFLYAPAYPAGLLLDNGEHFTATLEVVDA